MRSLYYAVSTMLALGVGCSNDNNNARSLHAPMQLVERIKDKNYIQSESEYRWCSFGISVPAFGGQIDKVCYESALGTSPSVEMWYRPSNTCVITFTDDLGNGLTSMNDHIGYMPNCTLKGERLEGYHKESQKLGPDEIRRMNTELYLPLVTAATTRLQELIK